jgi:hypothetical protein
MSKRYLVHLVNQDINDNNLSFLSHSGRNVKPDASHHCNFPGVTWAYIMSSRYCEGDTCRNGLRVVQNYPQYTFRQNSVTEHTAICLQSFYSDIGLRFLKWMCQSTTNRHYWLSHFYLDWYQKWKTIEKMRFWYLGLGNFMIEQPKAYGIMGHITYSVWTKILLPISTINRLSQTVGYGWRNDNIKSDVSNLNITY